MKNMAFLAITVVLLFWPSAQDLVGVNAESTTETPLPPNKPYENHKLIAATPETEEQLNFLQEMHENEDLWNVDFW